MARTRSARTAIRRRRSLRPGSFASALGDIEGESGPRRTAGPAPAWSRRTVFAHDPAARCRSPDSTAACGRSASDRPPPVARCVQPSRRSRRRASRRAPREVVLIVASRLRWPSPSATASTRNWLTRLDLPDPEMPVTAVNTPEGNVGIEPIEVVSRHAPKLQPAGRRCAVSGQPFGCAEQIWPGLRRPARRQGRPADRCRGSRPPCSPGARTDIDDPVGVPHHIEFVLDDEQRIAG